MSTSAETDLTAAARGALQIVCSGQLDRLPEFYDEEFVDHVNSMVFHGHAGARESVGFYRSLFDDLRFEIDDRVSEGQHEQRLTPRLTPVDEPFVARRRSVLHATGQPAPRESAREVLSGSRMRPAAQRKSMPPATPTWSIMCARCAVSLQYGGPRALNSLHFSLFRECGFAGLLPT